MSSTLRQGDTTAGWRVQRTRLPLLRRPCPNCRADVSAASGKFRVNASGKLLDIWMLIRCVKCDHTTKVTVIERSHVRSVDPVRLQNYTDNNANLIAEVLLDPLIARRNRYALDWTDAWELSLPKDEWPAGQAIAVRVEFADPVPVSPVRLIAHGLGIARGEVERLIADKRICSTTKLTGKISTDFQFEMLPATQFAQ